MDLPVFDRQIIIIRLVNACVYNELQVSIAQSIENNLDGLVELLSSERKSDLIATIEILTNSNLTDHYTHLWKYVIIQD